MVLGTAHLSRHSFHIDLKIVALYEIIKLPESKIVYFGTFKYAASGPSQDMSNGAQGYKRLVLRM